MLTGRNYPPIHGIRVPAEDMARLAGELFETEGVTAEDAAFVADLLVLNDLRCVYSHGTRTLPYYLEHFRHGSVNPRPRVRVVEEAGSTVVVDGDGGLGYYPAYRAAKMTVDKAAEHGVAAATTRNHFHIGSAGLYSRLALEHDCVGMVMSAHRVTPDPEEMILGMASALPLSAAMPAGKEPPLVLDMGVHLLPGREDLMESFPRVFFKSIGLSAMLTVLGGIMAGVWRQEFCVPQSKWASNQGSFIAVFDVKRFMPVVEFKGEIDRHIAAARQMKPFPGMDRAELPGGLEWQWERENRESGILVGDEHRQMLETAAEETGVESPFGQYEETRF